MEPRGARAERAGQTRREVLQTALHLFSERGYDGTSLQMIAAAMGVTKAAVYYHFHTKQEMLEALIVPLVDELEAVLDHVALETTRAARRQRLAEETVDVLVGNPALMLLLADPALRGQMTAKLPDATAFFRDRGIELVYGDSPTLDQRLAAHSIEAVAEALPSLRGIPDAELRPALQRLFVRILDI